MMRFIVWDENGNVGGEFNCSREEANEFFHIYGCYDCSLFDENMNEVRFQHRTSTI